jgi:hypothetical protein
MRRSALLCAIALSCLGCQRTVTPERCARWIDRFLELSRKDVRAAAERCPPRAQELVMKDLEKRLSRDQALAACTAHVGEPYDEWTDGCVEQAKTMKEMQACGRLYPSKSKEPPADPEAPLITLRVTCDTLSKLPPDQVEHAIDTMLGGP